MISLAEAFDTALSHHQAGRLDEAESLYRQILRAEPTHADTLYLLGRIEHQRGRYVQAEQLLCQATALVPSEPTYHHNLGEALRAQGQLDPAIAAYQAAIRLKPDYAIAYSNCACALQAKGMVEPAERAFREALRLNPSFFEAHNNLGALLREQQRLAEARECFLHALRLKPDFCEALNNLGNTFRAERLFSRAIEAYQRAIALNREYAPAHFNLANALRQSGRLREALVEFAECLRLVPLDAEAWNNIGAIRNDLGEPGAAIQAYQRAIELNPGSATSHSNLGVCLHAQGRLDAAIECYRRAAALDLRDASVGSNLLYALNYHPGYDRAAIFAEHRAWAQRHADVLTAASSPHSNDRSATRRIRVGYISPHFCAHAVNFFSEPILAAHDRDACEVFCYSDVDEAHRDDTTRRLQSLAACWRDIVGRSDSQVSDTIREDRIDILVDLTGHIGGNRLGVFARKPAPVQVTYLGYQNTTGMLAMGYRLTDAWSDPSGATERFHTEQLVRLPQTFFTYLPSENAPPVGPLPALARGYITFGSFNNFAKVTPQVLTTWAEILRAVPQSRMILLAPWTDALREDVTRHFSNHGIDSERVELCDRRPRLQYLQLVDQVDIALDPFPFNGHTTTCDALWQGVPVVALAGESYCSRFGSSALVTLGLQALIAQTPEQYVKVAVDWANDRDRLIALRAALRDKMRRSPLLDARQFTRNLEAAYRRMWTDWCQRSADSRAAGKT